MKKLRSILGQGTIEFAIIAAIVVGLAFFVAKNIAPKTQTSLQQTANEISNAGSTTGN